MKVTQERGWYACCDDSMNFLVDGWMRLPGTVTILHVADDPVNEREAGTWYQDYEAIDEVPILYATREECVKAREDFEKNHHLYRSEKEEEEEKKIKELYEKLGEFKLHSKASVIEELADMNGGELVPKSFYKTVSIKTQALEFLCSRCLKIHSKNNTIIIPLRSIVKFYLNSEDDSVICCSDGEVYVKKGRDLVAVLEYITPAL